MASTSKLINLKNTLWIHKKKTIFAATLLIYGANALNNRLKLDLENFIFLNNKIISETTKSEEFTPKKPENLAMNQ